MMKRLEIEKAENGYQVTVWKDHDEDTNEEMMYEEPKRFVAESDEAVLEMVEKHLKGKKEKKDE